MTNRQMAEIVRNQNPVTLRPSATVQDACKRMHTRKVGAVLVTDAKGKLVGIFTGRDCVRLLTKDHDSTKTLLKDAMTRNPVAMEPGRTAIEALRPMRDGGFRHVPIVDADQKVIGVVSYGDFRGLEHDRMDEETGYWERI